MYVYVVFLVGYFPEGLWSGDDILQLEKDN